MLSSLPKLDQKPSVAGFYKIEAVNKDTGERRVAADWFPNLITDIGLNQMGVGGYINRCMVGAGTATPTFTDTGLQTPVAVTTTVQSSTNSASATAPYYGSALRVFRFDAGVAAGNLSEVGVGWAASSIDYCYSRALILDSGGFPTTITILSNEFLDVSYELRCYAPVDDVVTSIVLAGVSYTCTIRAASATSSAAWAPAITSAVISNPGSLNPTVYSGPIGVASGVPTGSTGNGSNVSLAYEGGTLTKKGYAEFGLTIGNFVGGIQSFKWQSNGIGAYQIGFSPAIPKDNTKSFRIDVGISWARR